MLPCFLADALSGYHVAMLSCWHESRDVADTLSRRIAEVKSPCRADLLARFGNMSEPFVCLFVCLCLFVAEICEHTTLCPLGTLETRNSIEALHLMVNLRCCHC